MKLITKTLKERFQEVGDQSEKENPTFVAKFFNPCGSQTWYASEYFPEHNICKGYVTGMYVDEWGTFSISELENLTLPFGLKIERDIHFKEITFEDLTKPKTQKRESELKGIKEYKEQKGELER
ncbi:DUF2958 domain-containing protein [Polaribacter sp. MSW13]|uniref:DUF2958 domain-containing protein n=1 Tax=Polaribacter marinus TaxID=2916838 RepID=A0A9X2AKW4_9FLAO|nr:DUF2958 domain-containing protein [Polaribacter marinus]MCI2229918.1 DUF2958 domain-containing protein [Polaribacter marinus]